MFISLEGGEGSGKSLMGKKLFEYLNYRGVKVLYTAEPGGTVLGNKLTRILKDSQPSEISPLAELFLFNASRAQLVAEVINPALLKGRTVICDRFFDSTIAYQAYARGLNLEEVRQICAVATVGLVPDLTIYLDIDPEEGLKRKSLEEYNRFEKEDLSFHLAVRKGFQIMMTEEPWRFYAVDATLSPEEVFSLIKDKIAEYLDLDGIS